MNVYPGQPNLYVVWWRGGLITDHIQNLLPGNTVTRHIQVSSYHTTQVLVMPARYTVIWRAIYIVICHDRQQLL